jgi:inosine-uridine nucleoside N-ribohydrolase
MNKSLFIAAITLFCLSGCRNQEVEIREEVKRIIFDTDLGPDYDDAGALAFLHAMADSGKAEILATVSSNMNELVAPSINVINTYYGRADLPIGAPKTSGVDMGASQHWPDSLIIRYPHDGKMTSHVPDAVEVYRRTLAEMADSTVTIVTVGFLTNLSNLLRSGPDSLSPLSGKELISRKVIRLVSMAGKFPRGKEFNVFSDLKSSKYVFENWPTEIIFTGFEIGSKIFTGLRLVNSDTRNNPVKDIYRISIHLSEGDKKGRMSWDQTAVLIAVYGTNGFFDIMRGRIIINDDGSNSWEEDKMGKHLYVVQKTDTEILGKFIEDRMLHLPM